MATPSKGAPRPAPQNFIEALTGLSKRTGEEAKVQVTKVFAEDIPQALGFSGTLNPNESLSLADVEAAERRGEQRASRRFSNRLEQEDWCF